MTVAWPTFLPKPKREGHSYAQADLVERSNMEGGPMRARQKYSDGPRQFNISFALVNQQTWAMFEAYFKYDLSNGAAEFYLPVNTGSGVVNRRARFLGPPSFDASSGSGIALVTAQVQIIEDTTITQEQYQFLQDNPGFLRAEDLLDYIMNTLYPEALT